MRFNDIQNGGIRRLVVVFGIGAPLFMGTWAFAYDGFNTGVIIFSITAALFWGAARIWLWVYDGFAGSKKG